ncbi:hypothetical protein CDL15_Pgr012490 [Punica granatum]|uniref:Uncharacterized protein n=1 Tax=Punica granatum TaxID=22663 RepID=A0A218WWH6_PUNGR|nr:hypothetical protein CDL15_Pgr012490 [Punica granatum]
MRDSDSGVECLRIPRSQESESAVVSAFVVSVILTSLRCEWDPAFRGLDARPPGLLLALHGHIETFSKVPKWLYRLFDAPVNLGPFSLGYRRAAAFVTRMRNFVQIWSDLGLETFSKVPKRLYRLFDAPVNFGPFLLGYRRAAAFVTRMRNFVQIWSDLGLVISRVL